MSVYSPLLLPPPQLRGRELREILPPHVTIPEHSLDSASGYFVMDD
jgi:hypothetical protein